MFKGSTLTFKAEYGFNMGLWHSTVYCSSLLSLVQSWYLLRSICQAMPRPVLG